MSNRGFTIIEILITLTIISILGTMVYPIYSLNKKREKEEELRENLRKIRTAIDHYKDKWDRGHILRISDDSGYPHSLDILVSGVVDQKDPKGKKMYFLRRIPRDPFFQNGEQNMTSDWGIRSYDSEPNSPKLGNDVFDIYSKSDEIGLNGVPYKEW